MRQQLLEVKFTYRWKWIHFFFSQILQQAVIIKSMTSSVADANWIWIQWINAAALENCGPSPRGLMNQNKRAHSHPTNTWCKSSGLPHLKQLPETSTPRFWRFKLKGKALLSNLQKKIFIFGGGRAKVFSNWSLLLKSLLSPNLDSPEASGIRISCYTHSHSCKAK